MDQQRVRTTFTYQLIPTPEQERVVATVGWRCRALYHAGLQERTAAWEKRHVCVTFAMQSAHLPASKDARPRPDYRDRNAQVLHDVLHRRDTAFAACFGRSAAAEQPGSARLQGRERSTSCT